MKFCRRIPTVVACSLAAGLLPFGCGGGGGKQERSSEVHIQKACTIYMKFMEARRGQMPKSEKELADFLKTMPQSELDTLGITDRETALVSPRDGQPYAVVTKVDMSMMMGGATKTSSQKSSSGPPIVMHEKVGSGGKRYVVYLAGGGVSLLDEERFRAAMPDAK